LRLIYPFYEINHEGYHHKIVRILEIPELIQYRIRPDAPSHVFDVISSTSIKLARIIKSEYSSWSGKHEVVPIYIKPVFTTYGSDYYAFRVLCDFNEICSQNPRICRKRFKEPIDIFMELSSLCIERFLPPNVTVRRIASFCWSVSRGFDRCLIVEPVTEEELIDAMKRFTVMSFFDILPYMQRIERQ
jgi:hypothetical protein